MILIADNFSYQGRKPLDSRIVCNTVEEMVDLPESILYSGIILYVLENKKHYTFDESNDEDAVLGKWTEFQGGGTSSDATANVTDYNSGTEYVKNKLIVHDGKLYISAKDFTSSATDFDEDITLNNIIPVDTDTDTDTHTYVYQQNTDYKAGHLVSCNNKIYFVTVDFTSDNVQLTLQESLQYDISEGNLSEVTLEVDPNSYVQEYKQNIKYTKNVLVYNGSSIARVLQTFTSDSTETDIDESFALDTKNGNLLVLNEVPDFDGANVLEYEKDVEYTKNTIVYLGTKLAVVTNDYTSGAKGSTVEEAFENDVDDGNIIVMNDKTDMTKYMSTAPKTELYDIIDGGSGYSVGDIITTNTPGINAEITIVKETGEIEDIKLTKTSVTSTLGSDASISVISQRIKTPLYGGNGQKWEEMPDNTTYNTEIEFTGNVDSEIELDFIDLNRPDLLIADIYIGQLVYSSNGAVGRISSIAQGTGKIVVTIISVAPMAQAPRGLDFEIINAGVAYQIGDIVPVSIENTFCRVTEIGSNGDILAVEQCYEETANTNGLGAEIKAEVKYYVANGKNWYELPNIGNIADATLTEDVQANVGIGAASASFKYYKGMTFTDFVKAIAKKDIIPSVSFSASNAGLKEKGTTINSSTLTFKITNQGTFTLDYVKFYEGDNLLDTQNIVDGTTVYTYTYSTPISTDTSFKARLYYKDGEDYVTSTESNFTFVNPSYFGPVYTLLLDESDIKSLTKNVKTTKEATYNGIILSDQKLCYAYPASFGNLTSIKDANNFEYINSYIKSTIEVNGEDYNVYILTDNVTIVGFKQIYS